MSWELGYGLLTSDGRQTLFLVLMLASQPAHCARGKSPIPVSLPVGGWLMGNTGETAPVEPVLLNFGAAKFSRFTDDS
ncbi:MAG: hypothetical protein KME26_21650 [Oscillatoria princeps RMCB-10]|nr:hypothetical protein [Oscillatoria princeps RMCB-10]